MFYLTDKCPHKQAPLIFIIKRDDERKILNEDLLLKTLIQQGLNNTWVSNINAELSEHGMYYEQKF